jgi:hypothetical protein
MVGLGVLVIDLRCAEGVLRRTQYHRRATSRAAGERTRPVRTSFRRVHALSISYKSKIGVR